jgi:membrane associated rhomboid family serine protease
MELERPAREGWVEVHRAATERASRHHALVLRARGIPFAEAQQGAERVLLVPASFAQRAQQELAAYERENRGWPPVDEPVRAAPGALAGLCVYWLVLVAAWVLSESAAYSVAWRTVGRQENGAVAAGEWWLALTSLVLHTDVVHLAGNLVFGSLFAYLVFLTFGGGSGALAILLAGGLANCAKAWLQAPDSASVGASTCVFAAVGILAGSEWRRRALLRHRRLRRVAPFAMGVLILAYQGMGSGQPGDRTDVLAHVLGFLVGLPFGVLLASLPAVWRARSLHQLLAGLGALGLLVVAWARALAA